MNPSSAWPSPQHLIDRRLFIQRRTLPQILRKSFHYFLRNPTDRQHDWQIQNIQTHTPMRLITSLLHIRKYIDTHTSKYSQTFHVPISKGLTANQQTNFKACWQVFATVWQLWDENNAEHSSNGHIRVDKNQQTNANVRNNTFMWAWNATNNNKTNEMSNILKTATVLCTICTRRNSQWNSRAAAGTRKHRKSFNLL